MKYLQISDKDKVKIIRLDEIEEFHMSKGNFSIIKKRPLENTEFFNPNIEIITEDDLISTLRLYS